MAKSTRQYVFEGMEVLPDALIPFVEKRLDSALTGHWQARVAEKVPGLRPDRDGRITWDQASLLNAMDRFWADAFKAVLGPGRARHRQRAGRGPEQDSPTTSPSPTTMPSGRSIPMRRLMEAIGAGAPAEQLGRMRDTILRTKFTELRRNEERRKTRRLDITVDTAGGLKPWREVVEPHQDVATGAFQQAEFAADLGKVHAGSAPSEYRDPREFFGRTYLTDGLRSLLVGAARRLSGTGGDPVVELQTNFGGGKTHSMLALYHMAGGTPSRDLPGLDQLLSEHGATVPPRVSRAVVVGTSRGPQDVIGAEGGRRIPHHLGRAGLAVGRCGRLRPDCRERRRRHRAGVERARRHLPGVRALPHPHRRVGRLSPTDLQGRRSAVGLVRRQPDLRPVIDRGGQDQPRNPARGGAARVPDRGRRGRGTGGGRPAQADLLPGGVVLAARFAGRELRDRPPAPVQGDPGRPLPPPRQHPDAVREALSRQRERVSARVRRCGLPAQAGAGLPHPSRALRPALHGLGLPGAVPAHARRAAADGAGHPRAVDGQRPVRDDHAGQRGGRLGPRRAGAAPLPRPELAIDHRGRRGRPELDSVPDRPVRPPT